MSRSRFYLPGIMLGLAGLFYFYQYFLRVAPSVMVAQLVGTYQLSPIQFANLAGAFYYIYIPMQLVVGLFMDRFGPRRLLVIALLICTLGAYIFANSSGLWQALAGRLLVGLGSAFAFVGTLKVASIWLPSNRFSLVTGITISFGMLGGLLGDIILTKVINHEGWRFTNDWIAGVGGVLALILFLFNKSSTQLEREYSAFQLLPTLRAGWKGLLQLMGNRSLWINSIVGCLLYIPISGFAETWGISYLMNVDHLPKSVAATAISMIFLGWVCGAPLMGWISDRMKTRCLPLTIAATAAAILLAVILYVPDLRTYTVFLLLFVFGLFSSAQVLVFSISREISPKTLAATAIAITNMIVMFAGVSISAVGFLLNLSWQNYMLPHESIYSWDFQVALFILPLSLVAAVFLTFYLPETYSKPVEKSNAIINPSKP